MNKRKATVSQPPALLQKQLIQSILKFVPLNEAALSAKVCKSWHRATKEGLIFHPERLQLGKSTCGGDWEIFSESGFYPLSEIPGPKRSHLLEICNGINFLGHTWRQAIANLIQAPPNLKLIEFEGAVPTQQELDQLLAKIDVTNIEEVEFSAFKFSSKPVEHILNALPALKKAVLLGNDCLVDFKQVNRIETVKFWAMEEMPNLEGKVKVLQLEDFWDGYSFEMVAFDLDLIEGVDKIILQIVDAGVSEDIFDWRCEEICHRLPYAKEMSLKTFVIKTEAENLLQDIFDEVQNYDVDGWNCSLGDDEIVFKKK